MSPTAIVIMVLVLGFVWGGFLLLAITAVRKERAKREAPRGEAGAHGVGDPGPGASSGDETAPRG